LESGDENFGAGPAVYGTLVTSFVAMLIAVPIGLGVATFLTELCPHVLRRPIGIAIELLAGIPSIIYGIWGLFVFAPFVQTYIQPAMIAAFKGVPVLSALFAGPPYGIGMLTAGFILAIMILPFIASISRDVFEDGAAGFKGSGDGSWLHDLGNDALCRAALYARWRCRRRDAGAGARAWRNNGGDLCDWQCA